MWASVWKKSVPELRIQARRAYVTRSSTLAQPRSLLSARSSPWRHYSEAKSLSESTVATLKACQPLLLERQQALGDTFYRLLFQNYPEVRGQFNNSHMEKQQKSLVDAVVAYCGNCDNLEALLPAVSRISEKHVS